MGKYNKAVLRILNIFNKQIESIYIELMNTLSLGLPGGICSHSACDGSYGCDIDICNIDDDCGGHGYGGDLCYTLDQCHIDGGGCVKKDICDYDNECGFSWDTESQPCPPIG